MTKDELNRARYIRFKDAICERKAADIRHITIGRIWKLYSENLIDEDFNSEEDKECYLKECIEATLYFEQNVERLLSLRDRASEAVRRAIEESNETITKRANTDIKQNNDRPECTVLLPPKKLTKKMANKSKKKDYGNF